VEIRFWGVRGSIAAPGAKTGYFGGNTSCVEVSEGVHSLILDAGTGLRPLGHKFAHRKKMPRHLHLLLSHYHLDHLVGLPFFRPLYQKGVELHLYGPKGYRQSVRQIIATLFKKEYFPVPLAQLPAKLRLHSLGETSTKIKPFSVQSFFINHPGRTLGYVIQSKGHRVAYITDHEPIRMAKHLRGQSPAAYEQRLLQHLEGVDLLIHDAQYTDRQYLQFKGWGHSPWSYGVSLAERAGIPHVILFHHDPENDDRILKREFRRFKRGRRRKNPKLELAREGKVIQL